MSKQGQGTPMTQREKDNRVMMVRAFLKCAVCEYAADSIYGGSASCSYDDLVASLLYLVDEMSEDRLLEAWNNPGAVSDNYVLSAYIQQTIVRLRAISTITPGQRIRRNLKFSAYELHKQRGEAGQWNNN